MPTGRQLARAEVTRVWDLDRREVIDNVYYLEDGRLVLKPEHFDMPGWPPGEADHYTPILLDCFDRGGWFHGLFEGDRLIALAVIDNKFVGLHKDLLQLKDLYVGNGHRDRGFGRRLFELAKAEAGARGARGLYISATPSEHTINFYLHLGCVPTRNPDPDLLALEPEDIHMEYTL